MQISMINIIGTVLVNYICSKI